MGISCSCTDDYEWFYSIENNERISQGKGKCYGCGGQIEIAEETRRLEQYEVDENGNDYNWRYLGRLCPMCSGHYDSLIELGFCLSADWGFVSDAMQQYRDKDW